MECLTLYTSSQHVLHIQKEGHKDPDFTSHTCLETDDQSSIWNNLESLNISYLIHSPYLQEDFGKSSHWFLSARKAIQVRLD